MSLKFKIGRIINSFLNKWGYKIEKNVMQENPGSNFYEQQLNRALVEINSLYGEFVFNTDFENDKERLKLLYNLLGTDFGEGIYIVKYLQKSLILEGDVCEFGIAQGATSTLLAYEIRNSNKNIWLFDSFEGLPNPTENDILINDIFNLGSMEAYKGTMSCPENWVKTRLSAINFPTSRTKIIPGDIEKTINSPFLPQKICFAYVDFDFYEPILIALNYLDKVIQPGGTIIVDDYNFFSKGAKIAVDEFYNSNKQKYELLLPVKSAGHFCLLTKKSQIGSSPDLGSPYKGQKR